MPLGDGSCGVDGGQVAGDKFRAQFNFRVMGVNRVLVEKHA